MARDIGNRCKKSRRLKTDLRLTQFGGKDINAKCKLTTLPGQHGAKHGRPTDYGVMIAAKQMLKHVYGVLEKQFHNYYETASKLRGATGAVLLELLERRLDNVVYRMGFAATRAEARQLVSHKAVMVKKNENGKQQLVNIPSDLVPVGAVINIKSAATKQIRVQNALKVAADLGFPAWLEVDVEKYTGVFKRLPQREELPMEYNEQLVVELYSK